MLLQILTTLASTVLAAPLTRRSANGPVISTNFQDPAILNVGGTYYAYAGPNGNPPVNVITAISTDFSTWSVSDTEALPSAGAWAATTPHVWSPDVIQLANGRYVLYYAAITVQDVNKHCIGAATSDNPTGPFVPADTPLYCDLGSGGANDPDGFRDPVTDNQYVVYKVDGNSIGQGGDCGNSIGPIAPTPLVLQQVSAEDGISPLGTSTIILTNNADDGPNIEAPTLVYNENTQQYVLFFTSGCFSTSASNIQYATASSITGPYTRRGVFLADGDTAANVNVPGGPDVDPVTNRLVFHGDLNPGWFQNDGSKRVRGMYASSVTWGSDGTVSIGSLV